MNSTVITSPNYNLCFWWHRRQRFCD